jgi:hypothetical protein
MPDMPLALAWFLGSAFMLAGLVAARIVRSTNQQNSASLNARTEVEGVIASYDEAGSGDDWGRQACTIKYAFAAQQYQISAELNPAFYPVGKLIALMARTSEPSDAVLSEELSPCSYRWPIGLFFFGVVLLAWGYVEALYLFALANE